MKVYKSRRAFVRRDLCLIFVAVAAAAFLGVVAVVCLTSERDQPSNVALGDGNFDNTAKSQEGDTRVLGQFVGASTRAEVNKPTNPMTDPEAVGQAPLIESFNSDRVSELRSELPPEMLRRIDRLLDPYLDSTNDGRDLIDLLAFGKAAEVLLRSSRLLNPNGVELSQAAVDRLFSSVIREAVVKLRVESTQLGVLALQRGQALYESAGEGGVVGIGPEERAGEYAFTVMGNKGARVVRYAWGPDSLIHAERIQLRSRCLTAIEKITAQVTASSTP
jgi:hypothetical protein